MRRSRRPSRPRNSRVVWDEANLQYLDANRTPKQQIKEPKTPYHAPLHEDGSISPIRDEDTDFMDQAAHAQEICSALMEAASTSSSSRSRSRGGWTSSEDEEEGLDQHTEGADLNHNLSFNEHRKAHYDEFRKLKALRSSIPQPVGNEEAESIEEESRTQHITQITGNERSTLSNSIDAPVQDTQTVTSANSI